MIIVLHIGELMRMSINSIGWGDMDTPQELRTVLQHLDMAFRSYCSTAGGEMGRKMLTLKQSVTKVSPQSQGMCSVVSQIDSGSRF